MFSEFNLYFLLLPLLQAFPLDHEENPSFLAWNHYPPLTKEQIESLTTDSGKVPPRLHAHADMDVLTVLFQRPGNWP